MSRQSTTGAGLLGGLKSLPPKKSLGQTAYEKLKQAVVRGDFPPQSHLVEINVAAALGISRTPVREAIHKLEREGLLERFPGGGFFVTGLRRQDIEETFGIRSVLESYAARVATLMHKETELLPLEQKINQYQRCLDEDRIEELTLINTEFHDLLYGLSRSPKLIRLINELRDPVYRFRKVLLSLEEMARLSNEDHKLMIAHIRRRDADEVEKLVREHILRGKEVILRHFDLCE
ncbi:MAG: GntR family transcriptional regulator [Syntrophobacteraceae bacterium]|nr:GntR family transcriptional regulator [Syntrophobacteraceae bacterium]